jgi:predicted aspartyl protease
MYVDSGADLTLIPKDFGKLLGMNLQENLGLISGVSGALLQVSLQSAEIRIGGRTARAKVAVGMRNDLPYLLGRDGLFKRFKIVFEEYKSLVRFGNPR